LAFRNVRALTNKKFKAKKGGDSHLGHMQKAQLMQANILLQSLQIPSR